MKHKTFGRFQKIFVAFISFANCQRGPFYGTIYSCALHFSGSGAGAGQVESHCFRFTATAEQQLSQLNLSTRLYALNAIKVVRSMRIQFRH